jgi:sugar lactone lactonase YvrE
MIRVKGIKLNLRDKWQTFTTKDGLADNWVNSILEDSSGNIWFGTLGGGVSKYDGQGFKNFTKKDGLADNRVNSILEDFSGNIWFGTWGGGVSRYDGQGFKNFTTKDGLADNRVWSILEDSSRNIWFGTGRGVSRYDGQKFENFTEKDGLAGNRVLSILEDSSGNIWFGTWGGVSRYDGQGFRNFTEKDGLAGNYVYSILEDSSGNIWFGTYGGGVSRYNGQGFKNFTEKDGLRNNRVYFILEDSSGNIWFGTSGGGVSRYDGQKFKNFTIKDGLARYWVNSILEDSSGDIWFGTDGGVSKLILSYRRAKDYLDKDTTLLYPVIYSLFEDATYPDMTLQDLIKVYKKENNQLFVNIFEVYNNISKFKYPFKDFESQNLLEVLKNAVKVFSQSNNLLWAKEVYKFYEFLYNAYSIKFLAQITPLQLEDIIFLFNQNQEDLILKEIVPLLNTLNEIIKKLKWYERQERFEDKIVYLTQCFNLTNKAIEEINSISLKLSLPEEKILLDIISNWQKLTTKQIEELQTKPVIRLEIQDKEKIYKEKITLGIFLKNEGISPAEDIKIKLIPAQEFECLFDKEKQIPILGRDARCNIEFFIKPKIKKGDIPLTFEVSYNEVEEQFKEKIKIIERVKPKEFIRIENPYIAGRPLEPGNPLFVGRKNTFDFIKENLDTIGESILILIGERRIGKTSVLLQLLNKQDILPVYLDVQGIGSKGLHGFLYTIARNIKEKFERRDIFIDIPTLEDLEKRIEIFEEVFLKEVRRKVSNLKIVVLIDEFEAFEDKIREGYLPKDFFMYLRHLLQFANLSFIFTGAHKLEELTEDYWSVLFNIGLYHELGLLTEAETRMLIKEPVKDKVFYEDEVIDRIVTLTSGHPYFTQLICRHLVTRCNINKDNFITLSDLHDSIDDIITSGRSHFEFIWKQSNRREKIVLSILPEIISYLEANVTHSEIIHKLGEYRFSAKIEEVQEVLASLKKRKILEEKSSGIYNFLGDIYRVWLSRYKRKEVLMEEGLLEW